MKKRKFLAPVMVILVILISFIIGTYISSSDNILNINKNYTTKNYTIDNVKLEGFELRDNKYYSTNNEPSATLNGVNGFINNICFNGSITGKEGTVFKIFYTTNNNESFSEQQSFYSTVEVKGQKLYFTINKDVKDLKIQLLYTTGQSMTISGFEINPRMLNFSFGNIFSVLTLFTIVFSALAILALRKKLNAFMFAFNKYRNLLNNLIERDLKVKYRRSVLGFMWSVLNPLLMMLVITAVFSNIFKFDIKDFPVYYLTGALIFNFVSEATMTSLTSVISSAPLIKKVYIPKYIFPLEKCLFAFVNMIFSLAAVAIVFLILQVHIHWTILLFPIPMIYALVFSLGLSLILSSINVFFRDVGHLYAVWVTAWMYFTPIIYPITALPQVMVSLIKLNPLYYYVEYIRDVMLYGNIPTLQDNIICIGFSLMTLLIGLLVFKKKQDKFILYI